MIVIGEKINATRAAIAAALQSRDEQHIIATAAEQVAAGADSLDVNGGDPNPGAEVANMEWLTGLLQANADVPLCIDTANPEAMAKALALAGDLTRAKAGLTRPGVRIQVDIEDGKTVWESKVGGRIIFQPAVSGGRVLVATADGKLICLETGDAKADGWSMWGGSAGHNGPEKK